MQNLTKLFDDRSRYAKGLLTRLRNEKKRFESAKEQARIDVERRELPHSQIGLAIMDIIITIEKSFAKK